MWVECLRSAGDLMYINNVHVDHTWRLHLHSNYDKHLQTCGWGRDRIWLPPGHGSTWYVDQVHQGGRNICIWNLKLVILQNISLNLALCRKWKMRTGPWVTLYIPWLTGSRLFSQTCLSLPLTPRRYQEPCIAYAESHDQALVSLKWRHKVKYPTTGRWQDPCFLADWQGDVHWHEQVMLMYLNNRYCNVLYNLQALYCTLPARFATWHSPLSHSPASPVVERGMSLHKIIRSNNLVDGHRPEGWGWPTIHPASITSYILKRK